MKKMVVLGLALALMVPGMAFSGNVADVTQMGNSDYANVGQNGADNTADVGQYGNGLKADVNQIGTGNDATVAQGAEGAPVNTGALVGFKKGAVIYQDGIGNTASTTWKKAPPTNPAYGNVGSSIFQDGDGNTGTQDITANGSYASGRYAIDIQQVGDNNTASQTVKESYGSTSIQNMLIKQDGGGNTGTQTSIGGNGSVMQILQDGAGNISTQHQDGMKDIANATMIGIGNNTKQDQVYTVWGFTNRTATIDILGDSNNVTQFQKGVSSIADIDIVGDGNMAIQNQLSGNNNVAMLTQNGDGNFASQLQTGNSNSSTVSQAGNANVVFVVQHASN